MKNTITPRNRQRGVVLVISLIMLLLLTLIGITGTQGTSLEEKMAGNAQDQNVAFQAAESALKDAEAYILDNSLAVYKGSNGLLGIDDPDTDVIEYPERDYFDHDTWTDANSSTSADFGENFTNNSGKSIADPRFIIKQVTPTVGSPETKTVFKITARAQGLSPGTQIVLQEYFERTN